MPKINWQAIADNASNVDIVTYVISRVGNLTKVAELCHVAPSTVHYWRLKGRVPAEHVVTLESASGVPRNVIRPDLFE
jgi:DNA-binding transcriptional regulator YdaS (Cro superfamily)